MIAYNRKELEKHIILNEARDLFKSGLLQQDQWDAIQTEYANKMYSPSIIMKVFLFLVTSLAMGALMGPLVLIFQDAGMAGLRGLSFLFGLGLIIFTEIQFISIKNQYKSGAVESGIFVGFAFITFGILSFEDFNQWAPLILGCTITTFITWRYLNLFALVLSIGFFSVLLFQLLFVFAPFMQPFLPFIFMVFFASLYGLGILFKSRSTSIFYNNHFIIIQTLALILFYLSGNYFVVRELSVNRLGLNLSANGNIPGAYLFYFFTAVIPLFYMYWGVRIKSILFIRVALLCLALSVITLKIYFSLGMPVVTITVSGALMIAIALYFNNYLKQIRNGFTREKLLNNKWSTSDLMPFIASQTLGGSPVDVSTNDTEFGGGEFGGGGASSKF